MSRAVTQPSPQKAAPPPQPFPYVEDLGGGRHLYLRPQAMLNFNPAPRWIEYVTAWSASGRPVVITSEKNPDHPDYPEARARDFPFFVCRNEINHFRKQHLQSLKPEVRESLRRALQVDVDNGNIVHARRGLPLVRLDDDMVIREVSAAIGTSAAGPPTPQDQPRHSIIAPAPPRRGRPPNSTQNAPADFKARTAPPSDDLTTLTPAPKICASEAGQAAHAPLPVNLAAASAVSPPTTPKPGLLRRLAGRIGAALTSYSTGAAG
jgi:hypothetical protein